MKCGGKREDGDTALVAVPQAGLQGKHVREMQGAAIHAALTATLKARAV